MLRVFKSLTLRKTTLNEFLLGIKIKAAFINLLKYEEQKRRERLSRIQLITDDVVIYNLA